MKKICNFCHKKYTGQPKTKYCSRDCYTIEAEERALQIKSILEWGASFKEIAEKLNMSSRRVEEIIRNRLNIYKYKKSIWCNQNGFCIDLRL